MDLTQFMLNEKTFNDTLLVGVILFLILLNIILVLYYVRKNDILDKYNKSLIKNHNAMKNKINEKEIEIVQRVENYKLLERTSKEKQLTLTSYLLIFTTKLHHILNSPLGARIGTFTYKTFTNKKEAGITVDVKEGNKKVIKRAKVGYIIDEKYFISKEDLEKQINQINNEVEQAIYSPESLKLKGKGVDNDDIINI